MHTYTRTNVCKKMLNRFYATYVTDNNNNNNNRGNLKSDSESKFESKN